MEKESGREKRGKTIRNIGLLLVAIGLIASLELAAIGGGLAASGVIYERNGKKKQ